MADHGAVFNRLADALEHDRWLSQARPEQLAPPGDWNIWLLCAGRGFGKTRAACEWFRSTIEAGNVKHAAIVASTMADARDTIVEGPSGILSISPKHFRPSYEPSKRRLTWPNGAIASIYSCEEPAIVAKSRIVYAVPTTRLRFATNLPRGSTRNKPGTCFR